MSFVYVEAPPKDSGKFYVGFFTPDGSWINESQHDSRIQAIERTRFLNGGLDLAAIERALYDLNYSITRIGKNLNSL